MRRTALMFDMVVEKQKLNAMLDVFDDGKEISLVDLKKVKDAMAEKMKIKAIRFESVRDQFIGSMENLFKDYD